MTKEITLTDLKPLRPLELQACESVNDIITGMTNCSFGARMLGEATDTWERWIREGNKPTIISDIGYQSPKAVAIRPALINKFARRYFSTTEFAELVTGKNDIGRWRLVVVGNYTEDYPHFDSIPHENVIFINRFGQCSPGHIQDGHYRNSVFTDHQYALPLICAALQERFHQKGLSVTRLIRELSRFGGLAQDVAKGAEILWEMVKDPDCKVTLTLSGAMTPGQMSMVIIDMIKHGMVHDIFSSGAQLAEEGLNRVTDTLEPESNFSHIGEILEEVFSSISGDRPISPSFLMRRIGEHLAVHFPKTPSILGAAYLHNVPIYVPALVDSEIGNDLVVENIFRGQTGLVVNKAIVVDPALDTIARVTKTRRKIKRGGIYEIGGGVARNNPQNDPVLERILRDRSHMNITPLLYSRAVRICPDEPWYGHLSGCPFSEGISWGKFDPEGEFAEIKTDATIVWPFHIKYVLERMAAAA